MTGNLKLWLLRSYLTHIVRWFGGDQTSDTGDNASYLQLLGQPIYTRLPNVNLKNRQLKNNIGIPQSRRRLGKQLLAAMIQSDPTYIVVSFSLTPKWHFGIILCLKKQILVKKYQNQSALMM